jgi:DNA-binding HxlR family transcriptional regulator
MDGGVVGESEGCSLSTTLEVVGERWTFLILREALTGVTRFTDFRDHLGLAANLLTTRLNKLVEFGIMRRREYQDTGARTRAAYHLTDVGRELSLVIAALQQWGDRHLRCRLGPIVAFADEHGADLDVRFVSRRTGRKVPPDRVLVRRLDTPREPVPAGQPQ